MRKWIVLLALGLMLCPTPAASRSMPAPARGLFLVADEQIRDPRFREAVILLLQHDRGGTVGLLVNHPTRLTLAHALSGAGALAARPETVSFGGPLNLQTMLVLLQSARFPQRSTPVLGDVCVTGTGELAERLAREDDAEERFRVFMGYAGWAFGQLEAEIARGDWHLVPADAESIFDRDPERLWPALRGTGEQTWI